MGLEIGKHTQEKSARGIDIDKVTGLKKNMLANREIKDCLEKNKAKSMAVYVMDLDNFNIVGNSVGKLFGEEILREVADILRQVFRCRAVMTRVGEDKFLVGYFDFSDEKDVEKKAHEVCKKTRSVYIGENQSIALSMSIGISLYPKHSKDLGKLLEQADKALSYVKISGKDNYVLYEPHMQEVQEQRVFADGKQLSGYQMENQANRGFDDFGYHLIDLSFNLFDENKDGESILNLLVRKMGQKYGLGAVAVRGVVNKPRTLRYLYEYVSDDSIPKRYDLEWQLTEEEWCTFRDHFHNGAYIFYKSDGNKIDIASLQNPEYLFQTFIEVPMIQNGKLLGCIDYICFDKEKRFTELEINTMKMFSKIVMPHLFSAATYELTSQGVETLTEHDALTGLMKYDIFSRRLRSFMKSGMKDCNIVIIYSDLKHFKYINETYGYDIGNKLLQKFCEMSTRDVKRIIGASRVYSDNIVMAADIPLHISDEKIYQYVCEKNQKINEVLQKTFMDNNICACSGVFIIKNADIDAEVAVSNANMARKEAKKFDKNAVVLFDNEMMENVVRQMQLNAELPEALRNEEIKVYYQPKVESGTGKIVGGEALVRWQKADGSFIYPDEFIPGFEENGMIVEIDYYVYEQVFREIRDRLEQKKPIVPISMNISRVHLKEDEFLDYIKYLFDKYKIPTKYVEFELTESIYIENLERALCLIGNLREMGIRISMDDFGSGYSSLNVLNNLPIDILKLDKVFLHGSTDDLSVSQKVIISSVVEMASKLNIRVVCEGVETAEQVQFLTVIGCDMIQGYYYAKPMPEKDFEAYIDAHFKVKAKVVRFPFNGNLMDSEGRYEGLYVTHTGVDPKFVDGPFENTKSLNLCGDIRGEGLVEIPAEIYTKSSYTMTCWAKVRKKNMWSSLVFMEFENGFNSVMPNAGDLRGDFRIKLNTENEDVWHDTGSTAAVDDGWHFYAATYNTQTKVGVLYIDYRIVGYIEDVQSLKGIRRILIGGDAYTRSIDGCIAEFKLYNQALSRTDVISIFRKEENTLSESVKNEKRRIDKIYV